MVYLLPTRYRHRENRPVTYLASRILSWFILFIKGDLLKGKKKSTIGIDRKFEWKGREIEGIETRSMGQGWKEGGQLPLGQAYLASQSWLGEKCL